MTAIVDVGINIVASKALQGMKRIQDRTNQLAKSMTKFQRTSDRTWDKFGNKVRKTRRIVQVNLEKIKRSFSGLNVQGAIAGLGLGLFAKNAIQTAGNAQALELRLKLLTQEYGEYEKAQAIASKAAKTFGLSNLEATEGITNIIGRLRPLGVSLKDIESTYFGFNTAAKLAGVSSMEASNAFRQLAQALGSGRLQGDEFRSLAEQVPTLLLPIANELGTTVGKLKEFGAQGKITSDVVLRALKKIEAEGAGKIGSIIEESSLQRFKDFQNAMEDLSRTVGDELMPAITPLVKVVTKLVKGFSELNPTVKKIAIGITAAAAGLLIVVPAVLSLVAAVTALMPALKLAAGAVAVLTAKYWLLAAAVAGVVRILTWLGNKFFNWRKDKKEWNTLLKEESRKTLETTLAIEKETLARINSGDIMDGNATKVEKRIKQLEKELGLRKEIADKLMTDKDRDDIRKEEEWSSFYSGNIDKSLGGTRPEIEGQKKIIELTEKEKQLRLEIKDILAQGMQSAIEGLISGTKTLGQALADVAKSLASMFLQRGIQGMLNKMPFFAAAAPTGVTKAEGGYMANGIKPFASGGMATRPTLGLVGEAGEDEYIIPASKMAASMQRYSAGARGEAVIPGTGSSHVGAGGGASTTVNYSGPILNFNSEEFVPKSAVGQIIATATSQGARAGENRTLSTLRNSRSARSRLGM